MKKFRLLTASEIDCRVSTVTDSGCSLLLYKDARCDMNILDETVGPENWQRRHTLINGNLFCEVGIYVPEREEWVWKQDVGTESNTEKEKGEASDSFKRACFNWGLGRELYTAPFIWITAGGVKLQDYNGRKTTKDRFSVTDIQYDDKGNISALEIRNDSQKKIVFSYGNTVNQQADDLVTEQIKKQTISNDKVIAIVNAAKAADLDVDKILETYGIDTLGDMTEQQFYDCVQQINKRRDMIAKRKAKNEDAGNH